MKKKRSAHTQLETIAIVMTVVVVILSVVTLPRMSRNSASARTKACQTNIASMNTQIELFYSENDSWPEALTDVTNNKKYFPKGAPVCPSGGTYSINDNHHVSCSIHDH